MWVRASAANVVNVANVEMLARATCVSVDRNHPAG
jgi:hypothetical protein